MSYRQEIVGGYFLLARPVYCIWWWMNDESQYVHVHMHMQSNW